MLSLRRTVTATLGAALAVAPTVAFAHTGAGEASGFAHGFMHPVGGLDHILAMVTVGVFAAALGGRALWAVPASFVAMMAVGGAIGMAGIDVPFVELGIALSIVALGAIVAIGVSPPLVASMAIVGFFAIFHGHAHGAEMPADASGFGYAAGFMLATALLHAIGIGLGLTTGRLAGHTLARVAGGVIALAGVGMVTGVL